MRELHIIAGEGEVGWALAEVLRPYYPIRTINRQDKEPLLANILHICFPYSAEFVKEVKRYQRQYHPFNTVIHSTVPVGTSSRCQAVHSPIIGKHPFLEQSIKQFTKFLGGSRASAVADYFRRAGLKVYLFDKSETTELMKLLDTTFYGLCVGYTKEVKRLADKHKVPFEAWSLWTQVYNQGYQQLGYPEFTRPNLVPIRGKIGGHCVLPNANLLDSQFARWLKELNH